MAFATDFDFDIRERNPSSSEVCTHYFIGYYTDNVPCLFALQSEFNKHSIWMDPTAGAAATCTRSGETRAAVETPGIRGGRGSSAHSLWGDASAVQASQPDRSSDLQPDKITQRLPVSSAPDTIWVWLLAPLP